MIGHLGDRVSALLDGQLGPDEEERAWAHVHTCHQCRDLVEREGWVKTRLAGLSFGGVAAPHHLTSQLKGQLHVSILEATTTLGVTPGEAYLMAAPADPRPRRSSLVALGGGAAGAAVMGVLALGAAPANAPTLTPRPPVTQISNQAPVPVGAHLRRGYQP
jgi:hypothetical protein